MPNTNIRLCMFRAGGLVQQFLFVDLFSDEPLHQIARRWNDKDPGERSLPIILFSQCTGVKLPQSFHDFGRYGDLGGIVFCGKKLIRKPDHSIKIGFCHVVARSLFSPEWVQKILLMNNPYVEHALHFSHVKFCRYFLVMSMVLK